MRYSRSVVHQTLGIEGLRRCETHWHLGLGKCKHAVIVMGTSPDSRLQSYGGFMSSKIVEKDAGIHSLAMAVAVS